MANSNIKNGGNDYTIVKGIADDNELENYRLCFENNGTQRDIKNLQWLHQQNLANTHTIYYAMHDINMAAIYTAIPVIFKIKGVKTTALQSIDTITDINHRGKGLFPKLAARLYDDAAKSGFELVYGFPNENSAPGFFKKLKWISFGEAPFLFKPLRISYFINRILKREKSTATVSEQVEYSLPGRKESSKNSYITELQHFKEDYDQVWQKISSGIGVCVDRSAAYMDWRYVEKPGESYSKCGIYIEGKLVGVVVFTLKNKHNGRIGYVMELIYDDSFPTAGKLLLKYAYRVFKKEKVDVVLAWCSSHSFNYQSFRRSGYFNLPLRLRPQHLFLGVRVFNESNKQFIENWKNWYISYSDSDTV